MRVALTRGAAFEGPADRLDQALSLTLHPEKTRIGDSAQPGQGFDFLGYRFEAGHRYVRDKSLRAFPTGVQGQGEGQDDPQPGR